MSKWDRNNGYSGLKQQVIVAVTPLSSTPELHSRPRSHTIGLYVLSILVSLAKTLNWVPIAWLQGLAVTIPS